MSSPGRRLSGFLLLASVLVMPAERAGAFTACRDRIGKAFGVVLQTIDASRF